MSVDPYTIVSDQIIRHKQEGNPHPAYVLADDVAKALSRKAPIHHSHPVPTIASIPGLRERLNELSEQASPSSIAITDVINLQSVLNGKSALLHSHAISEVTGLQTELNGKAASAHTHAQNEITNLTSDLSSKSTVGHGHTIGEVSGLQSALDGKAATSHTHTPANITGVTDARLLGRSAGSTGACQEITVGSGLSLSGGALSATGGSGGGDTITSNAVTGDQSISAAGFVDITGLTFPISNGETWQFEAFIIFQSSTTAMGVLFGINGPTQSLLVVHSRKQITVGGTASTDMFSEAILTAYNTPLPNATAEPAQVVNLLCIMRGVIKATANGTVAMRFSKENVAGTATIKAGSFLRRRLLT